MGMPGCTQGANKYSKLEVVAVSTRAVTLLIKR